MKAIKNESYVFEDGDLELLRVTLPDNPCARCADRFTGGCCGCPPRREYAHLCEPYEKRDILAIAVVLKSMKGLKAQIENLSTEYERLEFTLPLEVQNKVVYGGDK